MNKQIRINRFLSFILAIIMVLGMLPTAVMAAESATYKFGTGQVALAPGSYELGVALMNAGNIESPSMAASCIQGGSLLVEEGGTAKVTVQLGSVTVGPITAWAKDWKVYQTLGVTGDPVAADYTEATVDGSTVPNSITFTLPDNSWDGVYVNMFVDAMGMNVDAYIAFDWAGLKAPAAYEFGSQQVVLAPGSYELGVVLMNAGNIESPSMAASCIQGGSLLVEEGGTAKITVQLGSVTVGPITAWAKDWKVYQTLGVTGDPVAADYTEATVDGSTVQDSITFTLPDNSWDGVYVNMLVDAMGMNVDAYMAFTWPGQEETPDVRKGTAQVQQFGKYDVNVEVAVENEKVAGLEVKGSNFGGTYADVNQSKLNTAIEGLKTFWNGKDITDAEAIYNVDAVSGATVSSEAIRDAVMDALDLTHEEDETVVPDTVAPGTYTVPVSYYTDVVLHHLTGSEISDAALVVAEDGRMQMDLELVSGSSTEPLYLLGVNGYYANNDKSGALLTEGMTVTMGDTDYSDAYFSAGTQIVTNLSVPLTGELSKEYATNTTLYVPAMNNLDGEFSGVVFDHGKFSVDSFIKVYWNELTPAEGGDSGDSGEPLEGYPVEADLTCYTTAMGGIDFGDNMVTDAALTVESGSAELAVALSPAAFTIYGNTISVSVDNSTTPVYYNGTEWVELAYTTAEMEDGTVYVNRITIPVTEAVETVNLGLHISRYQFGGPDASATSDGSKLEAVLALTWSDEAKAALEALNPTPAPVLTLDRSEVSLIAPKEEETAVTDTVTAVVTGADTVTAESNAPGVAAVSLAQDTNKITITPVAAGSAVITVTAAAGNQSVSKTIQVTVASSDSTAVGVSEPVVSGSTASTTISGNTIVTAGSDKVTVTDDQIIFDVRVSSGAESVKEAEVTLHTDTAKALDESNKNVVIETDMGSVSLDAVLVAAVAGKRADVTLTVSEAANPASSLGSFEAAYDLTLTSGGSALDFGGGKATVTVATTLTSGYAYHVENGKLVEKLPLTIADGKASWTTTHLSTWALSKEDYTVNSGSGGESGGTNPGTDDFFLSDGNHYVEIALWNAISDQASMGNTAFKNNNQALITVKNGKVTKVQIATNPVDVSGYHSAITALTVEGASVTVQETGSVTTEPAGNTYTYVKRASFTMPDAGQPADKNDVTYLSVSFTVPDTPMDEVVNGGLEARLKFTWSTAQTTSDTSLDQNSSSASGSSSITGKEIVDVDLVDKDTGFKLSTDSERLSDTATLSVEKLTSGSDYDTAVKAMTGITDSWSLYNITALMDSKVTAPEGSVTLFIPCTADGLTVYRINASGTKTVLKGEVKDGYYVLNTSSLGLFALVGVLGEARELPFTDVETGSWYYDGVKYAVEKGLFTGTSATSFAPNMELTRSMLVTVLYRLAGSPEVSQSDKFSDVQADSWYEDAVSWAAANGVVAGYGGGVFGPDDDITREQLALILYRYAQLTEQNVDAETDLSAYSDAGEASDFAREAMAWAVENGLITGTSATTLSPKGTATRAQVAVILMRYLEQPNK